MLELLFQVALELVMVMATINVVMWRSSGHDDGGGNDDDDEDDDHDDDDDDDDAVASCAPTASY